MTLLVTKMLQGHRSVQRSDVTRWKFSGFATGTRRQNFGGHLHWTTSHVPKCSSTADISSNNPKLLKILQVKYMCFGYNPLNCLLLAN